MTYGQGGGRFLPPAPIFNGVHPVGAATGPALEQMQLNLMTYLTAIGNRPTTGAPSVIAGANGSVGLACSLYQCATAVMQLTSLEREVEWFKAVLAYGAELSGPLATLYIPRPSLGICDQLRSASQLWT